MEKIDASDEALDALRGAMQASQVRLNLVNIEGREGIRIEYKRLGASKWRKHPHVVFPAPTAALGETLTWLAEVREGRS